MLGSSVWRCVSKLLRTSHDRPCYPWRAEYKFKLSSNCMSHEWGLYSLIKLLFLNFFLSHDGLASLNLFRKFVYVSVQVIKMIYGYLPF